MTKKEKIDRLIQVVLSCNTIEQKTNAVNWSLNIMRQMKMNPEEIFQVKLQFFRVRT